MKRIKFLDGLRGIAILLVILFHSFSSWVSHVPYGTKFAVFPFNQGFLGVELFFLISGFVIVISLEKTKNFYSFIYKRWIRLFPAMLIATTLIFITAKYIPERLNGMPRLLDALPGLIFIQANDIKKIFYLDVLDLENPFWSLYVEVKFYIVFGVLYFYLGTRRAILSIFLFFLFFFSATILQIKFTFPGVNYLLLVLQNLKVLNYGWFSSGAMAYLYYTNKSKRDLIFSVIIGLISLFTFYNNITNVVFMFVLFTVFISTIYFEKISNIFGNRFLVFYGFISYPLYLIHESAMIGLIIKIRNNFSFIPDILLPIIPILFLSIISYVIAKSIEPFVRKLIDDNLKKCIL